MHRLEMALGRFYPAFVLWLLTFIYAAAFIDRQVLNLLVDPIKQSLAINDTRFSLLQGLAFMIAFVAFSPVCGRLADRTNRRNLLVAAIVLWSVCTMACGFASSYSGIFAARVGIGVAEACVTPVGWSLIADYFGRDKLPRAMSVFLIGPYLGGGLALILGGVLIEAAPHIAAMFPFLAGYETWQVVFIATGAPGLLLGVLAFAVREPERRVPEGQSHLTSLTLGQCASFLWERRSFFLPFYLGMTCICIVLYSIPAWMPAVLTRTLGADPVRVGVEYGMLALCAGTAGVLFGPVLGRWLRARGHENSNVVVPTIAAVGLLASGLAVFLAENYLQGLIIAAAATFLFSMPQAMAASALQETTPAAMRGLVASLYTFMAGTIGLLVAPTLVAFITDHVLRDPARVNVSLGIVSSLSGAIAVWLTVKATRKYRPLSGQSDTGPIQMH